MNLELKYILRFITIFQFLLFSLFLITYRKGNPVRHRLLAVFLSSKAFCYLNHVYFQFKQFFLQYFPHVFYIGSTFEYLLGPSLFLYTKSLTQSQFKIKKIHTLHLIPALTHFTYMTFIFHGHSTAVKRSLILEKAIFSNYDKIILNNASYLHFIIYAGITILFLYQYRKKLKTFFSSIENLRLGWLNFLIFGFLLIWLLAYFQYQWRLWIGRGLLNMIHFTVAVFIFANLIVFFGLRQPEIFTEIQAWPVKKKYKKHNLTKAKKANYLQQIINYMKIHKPYLDPDLTLNELAKKINIPPRYLSQVINESLNSNFYDFINSYRIEESKRVFSDPEHRRKTILEVLYDVGFNSKSVFNTAFKKYSGMTPTEFKKSFQN